MTKGLLTFLPGGGQRADGLRHLPPVPKLVASPVVVACGQGMRRWWLTASFAG